MATSTPKPKKVNRLGLSLTEYRGRPSTLCAGCGHDAVSSQIMKAFYEMGINPHQVAKMSGIGCSSKTPAYFLALLTDSTVSMGACPLWPPVPFWATAT